MIKITVIYNQKSGSGEQLRQIKKAFEDNGVEAEFMPLRKSVRKDVAEAVKGGSTVIAAAGGDGTINAVAGAVVETKTCLGVIPAGTLNHFSRDLGIPQDLAQAVAILRQGKVRQVDVGWVGDQIFLNNSSIGIYPEVVRQRGKSRLGKWPAAALGFVRVGTRLKLYHLEIKIDDQPAFQRITPFVFIGNNNYGLRGVGLSGRDKLDSGKLCLYLVRSYRFSRLLRVMWRSFLGRTERENDLETFNGKSIQIKSDKTNLLVARDGEVAIQAVPLDYKIKPRALKVIAPVKGK